MLVQKELKNAYIWEYSKYQEVEYVEGSGNSTTWTYIDTWFKPNNNTKYVVDFLSVGQGAAPIWCYNNPSWWGLLINTNGGTYNTWIHYWTQYADVSITCGNRVKITLDGNKVYEGDTLKYTLSAQTFQMNINAWLFCWNRNGTQSNNLWTRIRSAKIYDDGTLVRDFMPCYRKSDNVIGMYDLVNDQFYTNAWTWTFTKWPDV